MADGFFFWRSLARSHLICLQMTAAILLMHSWLLCASHVVLDAHLGRLLHPPGGRRFFFSFSFFCAAHKHFSISPPVPDMKHLDSTAQLAAERPECVIVKHHKSFFSSYLSPSPTSPPQPRGLFQSRPLKLQLFSLHLHPHSYIFPLQMGYGWHFCTVDSLVIGFNGWCVDDVTDGGPARDPPSTGMFIAV